MSALDEFKDYCVHAECSHNYATLGGLMAHAHAAIAELEAELAVYKKDDLDALGEAVVRLEAENASLADVNVKLTTENTLLRRVLNTTEAVRQWNESQGEEFDAEAWVKLFDRQQDRIKILERRINVMHGALEQTIIEVRSMQNDEEEPHAV